MEQKPTHVPWRAISDDHLELKWPGLEERSFNSTIIWRGVPVHLRMKHTREPARPCMGMTKHIHTFRIHVQGRSHESSCATVLTNYRHIEPPPRFVLGTRELELDVRYDGMSIRDVPWSETAAPVSPYRLPPERIDLVPPAEEAPPVFRVVEMPAWLEEVEEMSFDHLFWTEPPPAPYVPPGCWTLKDGLLLAERVTDQSRSEEKVYLDGDDLVVDEWCLGTGYESERFVRVAKEHFPGLAVMLGVEAVSPLQLMQAILMQYHGEGGQRRFHNALLAHDIPIKGVGSR
jgi:hypothetical protein